MAMEGYHSQSSTTKLDDINLVSDTELEMNDLFEFETLDEINKSENYQSTSNNNPIQTTNDFNYQQQNTLEQFHAMVSDLPWNFKVDTEEKKDVQELHSISDPILPPQWDQLSHSTAENKGTLMQDMKVEIERISDYLTKRNKSFREMIHHIQSTIPTSITNKNIEELRKIAILIYKIMVIQTYHLLWTAYLKSSQGQLIVPSNEQPTNSTTIPIWPKEIKIMLHFNNTINESQIYLNFVSKHLHELDHQLKQYQTGLNASANSFHNYTLKIQNIIEAYIEQNLQPFRMKTEHKIELVHYDYHIRTLKLEYFRYKPNKFQIQLMNEICQSKYEQETAEQEYRLLKQKITYYNLPSQSFECSPITQSTVINSIQNANIRQQMLNQYKEIATQARTSLFHMYMKAAEDQREEYKKKYNNNMKKIHSDQQSLNGNQNIPVIMIQLINQRCDKISERIKCIYKFKALSTQS